MRVKVVVGGLICTGLLVAGCGTVSGQAEPENPTVSDPVFDPCDGIPDDVIRSIGLDPASKERDIGGVHQPGWNICGWENAEHFLSVYAMNYSMDDVRRNPEYLDFEPLDLDGRSAVRYSNRDIPVDERCYVAMPSEAGVVMVTVTMRTSKTADPCEVVADSSKRLLPYLPE